ncbi:MAG TPA: hypothetical protein VFQ61_27775, partial [Polyangiaceae bacterium]|nr:hypothetical protein [Polyangiaceae bacterium]
MLRALSDSAYKSSTARAFWIERPGTGELREERLAALQPGELCVQTLFSAVSRGTESLVFQGQVPRSEWQRMRCPYQVGEFPGPLKYGYINVGRVVAGAPAWLGRPVFCLYPHQTQYVVTEAAVTPIPDHVPLERAVLAANLETALNGVWDGLPRLGDRV